MRGLTLAQVQWRVVAECGGLYEVSNAGFVRSADRQCLGRGGSTRLVRGRILKGRPMKAGHLQVQLYFDATKTNRLVHHLVLDAFCGPRPAGREGCHRNGDPSDNRIENLYWGTRSDNVRDAVRHGTHWETAKTHCKRGHEFTPENTYVNPRSGRRDCRTCSRHSKAAYKARIRSGGTA